VLAFFFIFKIIKIETRYSARATAWGSVSETLARGIRAWSPQGWVHDVFQKLIAKLMTFKFHECHLKNPGYALLRRLTSGRGFQKRINPSMGLPQNVRVLGVLKPST